MDKLTFLLFYNAILILMCCVLRDDFLLGGGGGGGGVRVRVRGEIKRSCCMPGLGHSYSPEISEI